MSISKLRQIAEELRRKQTTPRGQRPELVSERLARIIDEIIETDQQIISNADHMFAELSTGQRSFEEQIRQMESVIGVSSVFERTGEIEAQAGDYSAFYAALADFVAHANNQTIHKEIVFDNELKNYII